MITKKQIKTKLTTLLNALGWTRSEVSLLITNDDEIQELNRAWLGRDRPTDVIAWSQIEGTQMPAPMLGDIVISIETADRQAQEHGHSLEHEFNVLLAHGLLHLLGHDHVKGGARARKMMDLQQELVAALESEEQ